MILIKNLVSNISKKTRFNAYISEIISFKLLISNVRENPLFQIS